MKKLTAGIFTALLGLVTVNAANAAIPSTNYVEERISKVRSGYEHDDQITLNSAKTYADSKVRELAEGQVATNKTDIASMDTFVAPTVQMTVGEQAQATVTGAINALDARITSATSGLATDGKMTELSNRVDVTETDISGLETRMGTAEGSITTLTGSGEGSVAKAEADAKAYADGLNTAADGRLDALEAKDIVLNTAIETNTQAIAGKAAQSDLTALTTRVDDAEGDITNLQNKDTELAGDIAGLTTTVGTKADQSALDATNTNVTNLTGRVSTAESDIVALETKTADLKTLAYQDIIDNSDITDGTIAQAKITNLTTDLAAKVDDSQVIAEAGTVTNADAEIPTIARMNAALDEKMPLTTTDTANIGADGTYVLTATTVDGATTYKWELIERVDNTPN